MARLCSGDPSIYSALAEQARRLDRAGVPWDVTPGVPAYAAAAALVGRELTVPEVTQTVILTRAQADSTAMPESESLARLAESRATLVLHLAIRHVRRLAAELTPAYGPDCPVVVVSRATQPDELVLRGSLVDIADQVEAAGLRQAAVIMVGDGARGRGLRRVAPLRQADTIRWLIVASTPSTPDNCVCTRPDDHQTAHVDGVRVEVAEGGDDQGLVVAADARPTITGVSAARYSSRISLACFTWWVRVREAGL